MMEIDEEIFWHKLDAVASDGRALASRKGPWAYQDGMYNQRVRFVDRVSSFQDQKNVVLRFGNCGCVSTTFRSLSDLLNNIIWIFRPMIYDQNTTEEIGKDDYLLAENILAYEG